MSNMYIVTFARKAGGFRKLIRIESNDNLNNTQSYFEGIPPLQKDQWNS
jgi:hypothetical protein